jgi:hypothetical protein
MIGCEAAARVVAAIFENAGWDVLTETNHETGVKTPSGIVIVRDMETATIMADIPGNYAAGSFRATWATAALDPYGSYTYLRLAVCHAGETGTEMTTTTDQTTAVELAQALVSAEVARVAARRSEGRI